MCSVRNRLQILQDQCECFSSQLSLYQLHACSCPPVLQPSPSLICISQKGDWAAEKVIHIPSKKVEGWLLPEMPSEYQGSLWGELYLRFRTFKRLPLRSSDILFTF